MNRRLLEYIRRKIRTDRLEFTFRLEFNGAETNCRIAHILGILLMNSCNTDIFLATVTTIICSLSALNIQQSWNHWVFHAERVCAGKSDTGIEFHFLPTLIQTFKIKANIFVFRCSAWNIPAFSIWNGNCQNSGWRVHIMSTSSFTVGRLNPLWLLFVIRRNEINLHLSFHRFVKKKKTN